MDEAVRFSNVDRRWPCEYCGFEPDTLGEYVLLADLAFCDDECFKRYCDEFGIKRSDE